MYISMSKASLLPRSPRLREIQRTSPFGNDNAVIQPGRREIPDKAAGLRQLGPALSQPLDSFHQLGPGLAMGMACELLPHASDLDVELSSKLATGGFSVVRNPLTHITTSMICFLHL
jgi:hypothetical protein